MHRGSRAKLSTLDDCPLGFAHAPRPTPNARFIGFPSCNNTYSPSVGYLASVQLRTSTLAWIGADPTPRRIVPTLGPPATQAEAAAPHLGAARHRRDGGVLVGVPSGQHGADDGD